MASRVISAVLKFKDQNFSKGLKKANKDAGDFGRYMKQAQNKASDFGQKATDIFKGVGVAAGALASGAIAGLGVAVGQTILEMDSAFAKLQAQTGAAGADLANLENAAKETFKKGYGESLAEVSDAVARVSQNIHDIDPSQIADVTSNALMLAKTFDSDINEVTRGTNNLMQAFGIEADKAFDLFAAGGQRGLNFSKEMFDNVAEYSSLFSEMGYSAEEYFGILERGSKEGVYNLDYVNDVMKEFQIRAKDGSKLTSDAMDVMSESTQKVWSEFLKGNGTVKDVASTVVNELKSMDNQTLANQIGVDLFGTKFEDLEADAVYAMLSTTEAMKDFEGATDSAAKAVEGSFGNRMKSAFRDLTVSIANLADTKEGKKFLDDLASTAEKLIPKITKLADSAMDFAQKIIDNWGTISKVITTAATAITTFYVAFKALTIISKVVKFIKAFRTAVIAGTAAQAAFNVALNANPIGLISLAIAGLVTGIIWLYKNFEKVKNYALDLWDKLEANPLTSFLLKLNPIYTVARYIYENFDQIKASATKLWENFKNAELTGFLSLLNPIVKATKYLYENFDTIKARAAELWENFKESPLVDFAQKLFPVVDLAKSLYENFDKVKASFDKVKKAFENFEVPESVKFVTSTAGKGAEKVSNWLMGSYAVGSNNIPNDQIAQIHEGEMIIPARQAAKVRAMGGNIDNIDKLINKPAQAVPVASSTTNNQTASPVINMTVNANQLSYDDVVYKLSKDIKLALSNM